LTAAGARSRHAIGRRLMDVVAIALALAAFALMFALLEGLERI
jgi:hypothetical protein